MKSLFEVTIRVLYNNGRRLFNFWADSVHDIGNSFCGIFNFKNFEIILYYFFELSFLISKHLKDAFLVGIKSASESTAFDKLCPKINSDLISA